jgi:RNA polymerase sigma factor (sigma-70 family)
MSSIGDEPAPGPGEDDRLDEAYVRSHGDLVRFLSGRLHCLATARDVAQEAYLRASQAGVAINDPRAFLFRTAANLASDRRKADRRHAEILAEAAFWLEPEPEASPESVTLTQEEFARVSRVIERLPPRCREVFYLNRFEGLSQSEIAERLGISKTAVEKNIRRALVALGEGRER